MIGQLLSGKSAGYRHLALDECASTNNECLTAAQNGEPGNLWITTASQTGGKGSRGRSWVSQTGNLFASLLLIDPCERECLSELTFVAAIAVRETLLEVIRAGQGKEAGIELKWPNDVLVKGSKISGILLESTSSSTMNSVVIGIGINCRHHPKNTLYPSTDLAELGLSIEPQQLFVTLANKIADAISVWQRGSNFTAIRNQWLQHAAGLGCELRINLPTGETATGIFEAVDERGYLLLKQKNGQTRRISVGDVFFQ
ncbi:MAG: biotin--[acetyl-CoA-carboxylase] ligase [Pseudomonadota bacterium]